MKMENQEKRNRLGEGKSACFYVFKGCQQHLEDGLFLFQSFDAVDDVFRIQDDSVGSKESVPDGEQAGVI